MQYTENYYDAQQVECANKMPLFEEDFNANAHDRSAGFSEHLGIIIKHENN